MVAPTRLCVLAAASVLLATATGCSQTTGSRISAPPASHAAATASAAARPIHLGPGPQAFYTVQAQPPARSCHYRFHNNQPLPDPACTPGALNPKVTQSTLNTTICRSGGYTVGTLPPASITFMEKTASAKSYGYTGNLQDAKYDHLISLQLGGDPNDSRNLWVLPPSAGHKAGARLNNAKVAVENRLHSAVCKGSVTLAAAQLAIATNWSTAASVLHLT